MQDYSPGLAAKERRTQRPSLKPVLFAIFAAFALGAATVAFLGWRGYLGRTVAADPVAAGPVQTPSALAASAAPSPAPRASETAQAEAVQRVEQTQGGLDQRLAAAEQRIARLDLQAQAASGNAARAEGLLIAFAARRAIERGTELGYLGDQLRLRFGDAQPNSVNTVIAFARRPVTVDQLLARLDGLGPKLRVSDDQPSWARFRHQLSTLFVIRRESTPSPQPTLRLERARLFLESGRIDKAIAEVRELPGADAAQSWIADASRLARVQQALDLLETAAISEPRRLRNASGAAVEQPTPVQAAEPAASPAAQPEGAAANP